MEVNDRSPLDPQTAKHVYNTNNDSRLHRLFVSVKSLNFMSLVSLVSIQLTFYLMRNMVYPFMIFFSNYYQIWILKFCFIVAAFDIGTLFSILCVNPLLSHRFFKSKWKLHNNFILLMSLSFIFVLLNLFLTTRNISSIYNINLKLLSNIQNKFVSPRTTFYSLCFFRFSCGTIYGYIHNEITSIFQFFSIKSTLCNVNTDNNNNIDNENSINSTDGPNNNNNNNSNSLTDDTFVDSTNFKFQRDVNQIAWSLSTFCLIGIGIGLFYINISQLWVIFDLIILWTILSCYFLPHCTIRQAKKLFEFKQNGQFKSNLFKIKKVENNITPLSAQNNDNAKKVWKKTMNKKQKNDGKNINDQEKDENRRITTFDELVGDAASGDDSDNIDLIGFDRDSQSISQSITDSTDDRLNTTDIKKIKFVGKKRSVSRMCRDWRRLTHVQLLFICMLLFEASYMAFYSTFGVWLCLKFDLTSREVKLINFDFCFIRCVYCFFFISLHETILTKDTINKQQNKIK